MQNQVFVTKLTYPFYRPLDINCSEGHKSYDDLSVSQMKEVMKLTSLDPQVGRQLMNDYVHELEEENDLLIMEYCISLHVPGGKFFDVSTSPLNCRTMKIKVCGRKRKFEPFAKKLSKEDQIWEYAHGVYSDYLVDLRKLDADVFGSVTTNSVARAVNSAKLICVLKSLEQNGLLDEAMKSRASFDRIVLHRETQGLLPERDEDLDSFFKEKKFAA